MVSAAESELVSGSPLSLTCPSSVDTPTTVMSNWTAPNSTYNTVNAVSATSVEFMISIVETADSGNYICSVRVTDSSGSEYYVVDSEVATTSVNIVIRTFYQRSSVIIEDHTYFTGLKVTIRPDYRTAPGEDPGELGPNEFTAGSVLSLNCDVQGNSTYGWTVTRNPVTTGCGSCAMPLSSTSTLRLNQSALTSYFAGDYTCTASESGRPDSGNSDTVTVRVVGKFVICSIQCSFYSVMSSSRWWDSFYSVMSSSR